MYTKKQIEEEIKKLERVREFDREHPPSQIPAVINASITAVVAAIAFPYFGFLFACIFTLFVAWGGAQILCFIAEKIRERKLQRFLK